MAEIITVTPSEGPDGSLLWTMCHNNKCGGTAEGTVYPQIDIPKGAKNPLMVFSIEGEHGIIFRKAASPYDASEAFYVEPGKGKNPKKGVSSDGQLENVTLVNGKTLVANNKNSKPIWLSYKLHFQQNNKPVTSIDPDIKNGGGGGSGIDASNFLVGASSAVVIGLAVMVAMLGGAISGLIVKKFG